MRRGVANYFEKEQKGSDPLECEVVDVPVRYVPLGLSALETRKARSFWRSDSDWATGLDGVARMQWGLLMGCSEDIIREIREARGPLTPGTGSTLEEYPVGDYPGYTLGDLAGRLGPAGTNLAEKLDIVNGTLIEVRDALLADDVDLEEIKGLVQTLVLFLGA